ncbi:amino acid adenylation domain-containing protein [Micromonospora orduensis]|uniref:Amino acid adenylation domain-containing protein n=1 Tax=Micromonospora orduensis TaxID=1420891 RepID=A0A5C4QS99_9ACTN|nr:amino acid adenylation domain-containing protein [Micromonospora orduensis]TNH29631.1 amino acid adenylation domain-containing protein [Micromonospora orduensis]
MTGNRQGPSVATVGRGTSDLDLLPIAEEEIAAARRLRAARHLSVDLTATVVGRLVERATSTPERVVAVEKDKTTTYLQLAVRTAVVRRALAERGCGAGSVVAAFGPRSVETIAIFLAVESLGGVYLPLDTAWPAARMAAVLGRSESDCVVEYLGQGGPGRARDEIAQASAMAQVPVVSTSGPAFARPEPDPADALKEIDRESCAGADEPRYLYFTSGTTGSPKGALIEHRGMVNHLWAKIVDLRLDADDTLAFTAPLVFDIAICQMMMPILVGGRIAVVPDADVRSPRRLATELNRHRVTVVELVPTLIGWLVTGIGQTGGGVPPLRCVISTGEELRPALARQVMRALPAARLMNSFGFTECSDDIAHHVVTEEDLLAERLPVGSVIINASLYVLVAAGSSWRAATRGERGELFVGGVPVGRGYIGDAEATRSAFFRDPFDSSSETGRLYRTGDLAVLQENGVLYYLGRIGRQVKVSGIRVEPDEVEAVLSVHPDVEACAVTAVRVEGNTELAAFVQTAGATPLDEPGLRGYLRSRLPPAMVPGRWFQLDSMPLSGNGKINHAALKESFGYVD